MDYFRNDDEAARVGGISIENRLGAVILHGSMTIVASEESLRLVRSLSARLREIEKALEENVSEGREVPVQVIADLETVDNPFL